MGIGLGRRKRNKDKWGMAQLHTVRRRYGLNFTKQKRTSRDGERIPGKSKQSGPVINAGKTKLISNEDNDVKIIIKGKEIEVVK